MRQKKHILLLITFLLTFFFVQGQTSPWLWTKDSNVTGGSGEGNAVCTDTSGNVYITGSFAGPLISFGSFTLTNVGSWDMYLVKYDALGNVLFAKSEGGNSGEWGNGISVDVFGNIYVIGEFKSASITFGSFTLFNFDNSGTSKDIFIIKYNAAGNIVWAQSAGGSGDDLASSVSTNANGNIFITGSLRGSSITFGSFTLNNAGVYNVYVTKYDSSGNVLWAKSAGGNDAEGSSLSADTFGNVYVTGEYSTPTITFGSYTLTNSGSMNVFIVKYDGLGNVLWAKSAGGAGSDNGKSISADAFGNAYVTGGFGSHSVNFGGYTLTNATNLNLFDFFIAKYDSSGNVVWAKSAGGTGADFAYSISVALTNIYVTGQLGSTSMIFGTIPLTPPSGSDDPMFIVQYDSSGAVLCATALGSGADDVNAVSADRFGNAYITGDFDLAQFIVGPDTLALTGNESVFTAKYNCSIGEDINNIYRNSEIKISPNPFSLSTTLHTDKFLNNATLTVYTLFGQSIKQIKNISTQTIILQRDNLPSGLYFFQLTQNDKIITSGKFVIVDN